MLTQNLTLRFPLDLLDAVKQAAEEDGRTISKEIIYLVKLALQTKEDEGNG